MAFRWPKDEDLPTWAHTAAVFLILTPFAAFLIWPGLKAVMSGALPPVAGPSIGVWMFGDKVLHGDDAVRAGWALIFMGMAFLSIGVTFSRWAQFHPVARAIPWALFACAIAFYVYVVRNVLP